MSQSQKALQAVLVEGITLAEAAERYGISTAAISKAKHHPSKKQLHATELDQLRTQLAEARLAESVHDQQANEYARKVAYWIEKHDALRAQLAEAQEQISEFQQANADIHLWRTGYRQQLAASQATNEKLREALMYASIGSCSCFTKTPDPEFHSTLCKYRIIQKSLALPNDTTALNKLLAGVYEECAMFVEPQRNDIPATGTEFAAAIRTWAELRLRALAKQKGLTNG